MLILYRIFTFSIYYITWPFTFIRHLSKSIKWSNRLGYFEIPEELKKSPVIWLHASSMGEVNVLSILKNHIEIIDKTISIFITVMTETGYNRAGKLLDNSNQVGYLPLDYSSAIRRFMKTVNIRAAVFIETEIWPNIIHELGKKDIPIFLANGRLSEKSCRRYIHFKKALSRLFKNYRRIIVQSEIDRDRFLKIGAPDSKIDVIGSLKFDAPMNLLSENKKIEIKRSLPFKSEDKILIAGSTRKGENEIILRLYKKLHDSIANVNLILVPRHLERVSDIAALAQNMEMQYCLYSELKDNPTLCRVLIVDKIGILNELYAISDIAFVGGTLADIGGHNILEPVWAGIPVVYGPSIHNVKDSSEYIMENKFGEMVQNENILYERIEKYFKGKITYNKKGSELSDTSRAARTAKIILDSI